MSNWNLSSSEDEGSFEEGDDDSLSSQSISGSIELQNNCQKTKSIKKLSPRQVNTQPLKNMNQINQVNEDNDSGDDESLVDWEDGASISSSEDEVETENENNPLSRTSQIEKMTLKPLALEIDDTFQDPTSNSFSSKKQMKKRSRKKLTNLSESTERLLQNIHNTHLLTLASRACFISQACSNDVLLHIAHSLIPSTLMDQLQPTNNIENRNLIVPSVDQVRILCQWYFPFVNEAFQRYRQYRRRNVALGAPTLNRRSRSSRKRSRPEPTLKHSFIGYHKAEILEGEGGGCTSTQRLLLLCHALAPPHPGDNELSNFFTDLEYELDFHNLQSNITKEEILQLITPHEKTQLLVSIARSLGWRIRYVTAIQPISTELTVHHPLLSLSSSLASNSFSAQMIISIFRSICAHFDILTTKKQKKTSKSAKQLVSTQAAQNQAKKIKEKNLEQNSEVNTFHSLAWVEFLCTPSHETKRKSTSTSAYASHHSNPHRAESQWIHIDPHRCLFHKPLLMESYLPYSPEEDDEQKNVPKHKLRKHKYSSKAKNSNQRRRRRKPVSFVLGVEHPYPYKESIQSSQNTASRNDKTASIIPARITDVTPRYANIWSQTLLARGTNVKSKKERNVATTGNQLKCSNKWWSDTIKRLNRFFRDLEGIQKVNKRPKNKLEKVFNVSVSRMEVEVDDLHTSKIQKFGFENDSKKISPKRKKMVDVIAIDDESDENIVTIDDENINDLHSSDEEVPDTEINEPLPTSMKAFNNHPLYALSSQLNRKEVLSPTASKNICGIFKGEIVYRRRDVSTARTAKKWLYEGRKVKEDEFRKPIKKIKRRAVNGKGRFKALSSYGVAEKNQKELLNVDENGKLKEDDGMDHLYGKWQTHSWTPPYIVPNEPLPVNEHNNIEKALLNPGLVHLPQPHMSKVARKLGIPYAPCLLGFEGHHGNRTPKIQGIVVHEPNAMILREAFVEWESGLIEREAENRRRDILWRWARLTRGLLTRDRLDREYGDGK